MAHILKVAELREELSKRGLTTTGIKATLVKRLESAIHTDINDRLQKRAKEESEDEDGDFATKIMAVDDLRSLSVKQLREEASLRGVSTGGSKKQLLEKLCECSQRKNPDVVEGSFFICFLVEQIECIESV
ncbi:poly [ADP-ribose] polymerase 2-like [Helianthus annuus]|uniref:poly [ADP-ribose] polymerase 2-like n=1 Tax=Helianthus annuus TaxID=4232 RepID=UPI000B8FBE0F|nr:poly [ADP-ribose] polymerase 2-like [Helianthus annuus]